MRKLLLIPLTVLLTVLVSCGDATRRELDNGVCYEKTRIWLLGVTVMTDEYPVAIELCP